MNSHKKTSISEIQKIYRNKLYNEYLVWLADFRGNVDLPFEYYLVAEVYKLRHQERKTY